jgi:hypothetical protein
MNLNHAFGFLFVGTVFGLLPRFAPGWCPATGIDGTSARELWLQLMSALLIGIAVSHLGRRMCSFAASLLAYDFGHRTAGDVYVLNKAAARPGAVRTRRPKLLPVRALQAGLLERRPAA